MEGKLKLWRTLEDAFECFRRSVKSNSGVDGGPPFSLLVRRLRRYFHRPADYSPSVRQSNHLESYLEMAGGHANYTGTNTNPRCWR